MQMFTVPLSLKETITEVVRALAYTNQERGLQTIEDLGLDGCCLVLGDPVRLHQIFMNLLSNAYKFTPRGSVTVKARIISESARSIKTTCSVADTGIGISDEQLKRLFQPFSQADSSTARSYGGSGLGLSICKAMIENVLGGKIWLESTPGVGTTVSFTLTFQKAPKDAQITTKDNMNLKAKDPDPMANWSQSTTTSTDSTESPAESGEEESSPPATTKGTPPAPAKSTFADLTTIPRSSIRVCIAEDNAINRKIALSYVKKLGLQASAYDDGKQAYEALRCAARNDQPFHLVLMDVQMPVLDGYEATRAIRRDEDRKVREVLIIAMTASAIRGDREKCLEAGMNNYLAKPVKVQVLKGMLDAYLMRDV
jgi:CheY-like chemotaxis protein